MKFCQQCRTQPATLKRDGQIVCTDCYGEKPLPSPGQWDRVINPAYILALEKRIERLEKLFAGMEADS